MVNERITIGALARRSGVPVKTLRFYSDEGLLPPVGRTHSGYRVYAEDAIVRLDLIRTLREAGLAIAAIKAILARDMTLAEALRLRLGAVEAHIASLQHIAAALRATLRSEPEPADIRRLSTVTRITSDQRKAIIERFHQQISEGVPIDDTWKRQVMQASTPTLPEVPTPEQLDAWIELTELVQDEAFVATMRAAAAETWNSGFDAVVHQRVSHEAHAAARELIARGVAPTDAAARAVVDRMAAGLAAARGEPDTPAWRATLHEKSRGHDPRTTRYWQLAAILKGEPLQGGPGEEWHWLNAAVAHQLAPD
ncbi:helix-turn-helix domain-containing protein [Nannocystis bainbridge]|uniref:MerR family transcriptional regulator n=1 Tax=Nannocystis bainbridge TaxID=2995303 RepID=A0ABT5DWT2_9BACT|nr:MerR family transcriptional regulator [Nannocystis bainbridge]MDC0718041.1 MerR family transcriptional regulator [Nannocystis bainbridge]